MTLSTLPETLASPLLRQDVRILGIGTSVPSFSITQQDALEFALSAFDIKNSTKTLYRRTFGHKSIERRHFALNDLSEVLEQDRDKVNLRFQTRAVELSKRALTLALQKSHLDARKIDFLAAATCTGYLCPGLTSYLVEACGLRPNTRLADIVGMGCGAALPSLEQAHNYVLAHPGAIAAVVCTEICSAAMFSNDDVDIVISNTLFADGSAAILLQSEAPGEMPSRNGAPHPRILGFSSRTIPEWREALRFKTEQGYLKNSLGKDVPEQAARALQLAVSDLLTQHERVPSDIDHWILHSGRKNSFRN